MYLQYRQAFCILKRKADVHLASSHHPRGHLDIREGHPERRLEGKQQKEEDVCIVLCVCVCVCVCALQKLFSSQCWEQLQAGLPVLPQETKWRRMGGLEQCCESQHHPG